MPRRVAVVVNPAAGRCAADCLDRVRRALSARTEVTPHVLRTTVIQTGAAVTREALAEGADLVIACGGDGTVMACADALLGSGIPLGIIPAGTGNILASSLGIPAQPEAALAVALGVGRVQVDVCRVGAGAPFFAGSIGATALVMRDASRRSKKRFGMAAYGLSTVRHLFDGPREFRVTCADEAERLVCADAVLVGNYARLVRSVRLATPRVDDGVIEVGVLRFDARWRRSADQSAGRRHVIEWQQCRGSVRVECASGTAFERDGDWAGPWPGGVVTVTSGQLSVCAPTWAQEPGPRTLAGMLFADLRSKLPRPPADRLSSRSRDRTTGV
ncbi:diacylglycerol/lipid kinase family protein [Pedococcus sp. 5OH_020]|uniref:diacylglycerol/lipid kinase family protein n=1 Tax=Pedococcus sp. 5OH_020 TaxID=2989814 RepID=UPI0022E9ED5C|nr:diacylglycerol kinase family protein [Pedococcus sp. 5OH_020]